jgi:hypothetical protein
MVGRDNNAFDLCGWRVSNPARDGDSRWTMKVTVKIAASQAGRSSDPGFVERYARAFQENITGRAL